MTTTTQPLNELAQECLQTSARYFPEVHTTARAAVVHFTLGLTGEAGEIANVVKKFNRGSLEWTQVTELLRHELADVLIYLLDLAAVLEIDLDRALSEKQAINEERFGWA